MKQITMQNEGVSASKEMIANDDDSNKTPVTCSDMPPPAADFLKEINTATFCDHHSISLYSF